MRETRTLEFKESITNTFLKTVSAFSNYVGGTILFGDREHEGSVLLCSCKLQGLSIAEQRDGDVG